MNFKGIFKNLGADAAQAGGIAVSGLLLNKIPVLNEKPVLKSAAAYGIVSLIGGKVAKKGIVNDLMTGLKLGFAANVVSAGLKKVPGLSGISSMYVGGTEEFIRVVIPQDPIQGQIDAQYVSGVL